jgi:hypothetical protein
MYQVRPRPNLFAIKDKTITKISNNKKRGSCFRTLSQKPGVNSKKRCVILENKVC